MSRCLICCVFSTSTASKFFKIFRPVGYLKTMIMNLNSLILLILFLWTQLCNCCGPIYRSRLTITIIMVESYKYSIVFCFVFCYSNTSYILLLAHLHTPYWVIMKRHIRRPATVFFYTVFRNCRSHLN